MGNKHIVSCGVFIKFNCVNCLNCIWNCYCIDICIRTNAYRVATEILSLNYQNNYAYLKCRSPKIPPTLPQYTIKQRFGKILYSAAYMVAISQMSGNGQRLLQNLRMAEVKQKKMFTQLWSIQLSSSNINILATSTILTIHGPWKLSIAFIFTTKCIGRNKYYFTL